MTFTLNSFNIMKLLSLLIIPLFSIGLFAQEADESKACWDNLTKKNHPRLFLTDSDIENIKAEIENGTASKYLVGLHEQMMVAADKSEDGINVIYGKALSNIRAALKNIMSSAYAWRYTGNKKYLKYVERDVNAICDDFMLWHAPGRVYTINTSESALALSLAYDWAYEGLKPKTKEKILQFIAERVLPRGIEKPYLSVGNTSLVNNTGLICSALATYEIDPEKCRKAVMTGVGASAEVMGKLYSPDGIFPESPSYADYATMYEALALIAMSDLLGTDFGLSDTPGFDKSGDYYSFVVSNTGNYYNFSDCNPKVHASTAVWYYAYRFGKTEILPPYLQMLEKKRYAGNRCLFLALTCAYRMGEFDVMKKDAGHIFTGRGLTPVVLIRSGVERNDAYLGLKGGQPSASSSHAHMDAGSFIFEIDGVRWACELDHHEYNIYRKVCKSLGVPSSKNAGDLTWQAFPVHNRQHNTLTVNDKDHSYDGYADVVEVFDEPGRMGGKVDMSEVFPLDLKSAVRSISIIDDNWLEVRDSLVALDDKSAHVRWTMATKAKVTRVDDGFILEQDSHRMKLTTDAPMSVYTIWSSNPKDYDSPFSAVEPPFKGTLIGFEFDLPAGTVYDIKTTLKHL